MLMTKTHNLFLNQNQTPHILSMQLQRGKLLREIVKYSFLIL